MARQTVMEMIKVPAMIEITILVPHTPTYKQDILYLDTRYQLDQQQDPRGGTQGIQDTWQDFMEAQQEQEVWQEHHRDIGEPLQHNKDKDSTSHHSHWQASILVWQAKDNTNIHHQRLPNKKVLLWKTISDNFLQAYQNTVGANRCSIQDFHAGYMDKSGLTMIDNNISLAQLLSDRTALYGAIVGVSRFRVAT